MKGAFAAHFAMLLVIAGCASSGGGAGERGRDTTILTRDEIASVNVPTLYDAVQRLRPRWLTSRGQRSFENTTDIVVYQGQTMLGGVSVLRDLGPDAAESLQFLDSTSASATLPGLAGRHVDGAIVIQIRTR